MFSMLENSLAPLSLPEMVGGMAAMISAAEAIDAEACEEVTNGCTGWWCCESSALRMLPRFDKAGGNI